MAMAVAHLCLSNDMHIVSVCGQAMSSVLLLYIVSINLSYPT